MAEQSCPEDLARLPKVVHTGPMTETTAKGIRAFSTSGTVHLAGYLSERNRKAGHLTQLCGFSSRQRYALSRCEDQATPVTCAKCAARLT